MKPTRALVWRPVALRCAIAALPVWFTIAVLVFNTPWRLKLLVGGFFAAAFIAPAPALLAVAVVAPLGRFIAVLFDLHTFRGTEAIIVAFLAGWLLRARPEPGRRWVPAAAAWLAAAAICASIAAQAWRIAHSPGALSETLRTLFQAYYIIPDRIGFGAGARLLEGIGLLVAIASLFRTRPRLAVGLPAALTVSAVVAAGATLLMVKHIGLAPILAQSVGTAPRLAANVGDVNAAGSYFGMMLLVAVGMAARRLSVWSGLWIACAALEAAALWITGSRTAFAATIIVGSAGLLYALIGRWPRTARAAALAFILAAALVAGLTRAWILRRDDATTFRRDFYATSARMIAARPIVGVGIGQYYDTSPLFLSRFLGWTYGFENAHNFYLQLAAELGVAGAAPLIALLALVVIRGVRGMLMQPGDRRLIGCACGVTTMLATCLTGHPLLLDEVASPFWLLAGLVLALSGSMLAAGAATDRRQEVGSLPLPTLAFGAVAVLFVYVAGARRPIVPSDSIGVSGLEPWETAADGERYRWTLDYASVFVPRGATRVLIPVRLPVEVPQIRPMGVEVRTAGIPRGRSVVGRDWATLDVELPPIDTHQAYRRVDLKVDRTWQPAIYIPGSRDLRHVGIQVGEVKTVEQ